MISNGVNKFSVYIIMLLGIFSYYSELAAENQNALSKDQMESLSRIQMPFIKNEGQIKSEEVKFYVQTFNGTVFITDKGGLVYTVVNQKDYLGTADYILPDGSFSGRYAFSLKETPLTDNLPRTDSLSLPCQGSLQVNGLENSPTAISYFLGDDPKNWRSNIQSYNLITLGEVWPGITVNLKANSNNIEKLFIITPDGTPESIKFSVEGVEQLSVTQTGELELKTGKKSIGFTPPIAYQEIPARPDQSGRSGGNGGRKSVQVSFRLIDKNTYGFMVGDYDKTIPLVIDPLLSSTFIGGIGTDFARAVIIDPVNGNVFVTGYTQGSPFFDWTLGWIYLNDFPTQGETPLTPYNDGSSSTYNGYYIGGGSSDVFICKLNPTLTTLIASTYLGGTGSDGAYGIALDSQGYVFVCGFAGPGFPVLTDYPAVPGFGPPTPFGPSYNGPSILGQSANFNDGMVAKLSNSLNALLAATYWGGTQQNSLTADTFTGIVIDDANNIIVCGYTDSNASQALGLSGSVYYPSSNASSNDYNGGSGAYPSDAFVAKFNNYLSNRIPGRPDDFYFAGNFLGGTPTGPPDYWPGNDIANAITMDELGNVYITGWTTLGSPIFPTLGDGLTNPYDTQIDSSTDAFIAKFSNDLRTFLASTYLGRIGSEIGYAITMGPPIAGEPTVYVTGITGSPLFPVVPEPTPNDPGPGDWNPGGATQPGLGTQDVFITRIKNTLTGPLIRSTWIGGLGSETAYGICVKETDVYICGTTNSGDFPITQDAFGITNTGGVGDVFVCRFNGNLSLLNASSMIGGEYLDAAYAIRPDNTGNIVFVGVAGDEAYPTWPTEGENIAYQPEYYSAGDAFVTRITNDLSGGYSQQQQDTSSDEGGPVDEGEGLIAGSSALAYLPANAFTQNCFIATAVYGNPMHPNVVALRNFRDKYLLTNKLGSRFVDWYYRTSPPVAEYLKHTPLQASAVRCALTPIVYTIKYPILIPIIGGLLFALCYWLRRRYAKQHPAA